MSSSSKTRKNRSKTRTRTSRSATRTKTKRSKTRTRTKRSKTRTRTNRSKTRTKTNRSKTRTKTNRSKTRTKTMTKTKTNRSKTRTSAPDRSRPARIDLARGHVSGALTRSGRLLWCRSAAARCRRHAVGYRAEPADGPHNQGHGFPDAGPIAYGLRSGAEREVGRADHRCGRAGEYHVRAHAPRGPLDHGVVRVGQRFERQLAVGAHVHRRRRRCVPHHEPRHPRRDRGGVVHEWVLSAPPLFRGTSVRRRWSGRQHA